MMAGPAVTRLLRPVLVGTLRTRQARTRQSRVTAVQWLGFVAVAVASAWLREAAENAIERHLGPPSRSDVGAGKG